MSSLPMVLRFSWFAAPLFLFLGVGAGLLGAFRPIFFVFALLLVGLGTHLLGLRIVVDDRGIRWGYFRWVVNTHTWDELQVWQEDAGLLVWSHAGYLRIPDLLVTEELMLLISQRGCWATKQAPLDHLQRYFWPYFFHLTRAFRNVLMVLVWCVVSWLMVSFVLEDYLNLPAQLLAMVVIFAVSVGLETGYALYKQQSFRYDGFWGWVTIWPAIVCLIRFGLEGEMEMLGLTGIAAFTGACFMPLFGWTRVPT